MPMAQGHKSAKKGVTLYTAVYWLDDSSKWILRKGTRLLCRDQLKHSHRQVRRMRKRVNLPSLRGSPLGEREGTS